MRVCVFGNSHVAAMHLGWKLISESYPHAECVFFGAPNGDMSGVEFKDSMLVPTEARVGENFMRTGGSDRITLADYDAIVIVGCRIGVMHYHRELGQVRLHEPQSRIRQGKGRKKKNAAAKVSAVTSLSLPERIRAGLAKLMPAFFAAKVQEHETEDAVPEKINRNRSTKGRRGKGRIISRTFMSHAIEQMVRQSRLYYLAERISSQARIPVYFVATPHSSTYSLVQNPKYKLARTVSYGWNAPFAEIFWNSLSAALADKAVVVRQPEETVVDHVFTKEEYSLTRKGTNSGQEEVEMIDNVHMNAAYGAIVMRDLVARIAAAAGAKAAPESAVA